MNLIYCEKIIAGTHSYVIYFPRQLAQTVVDAGAIAHLAQMVLNSDAKLKVFILNSPLA